MQIVHNTHTDDIIEVPDFVADKLLAEKKVFKCSDCGMFHTDETVAAPKQTYREACRMAAN